MNKTEREKAIQVHWKPFSLYNIEMAADMVYTNAVPA